MKQKIHIAVVGSRRRTDKKKVFEVVDRLPHDCIVVSGGCRGVDEWAVDRAKERNLEVLVFKPSLSGVNSHIEATKRYYARNKQVAEASDIIHAFVAADRTGGTENTLKHARALGKNIIIHEVIDDKTVPDMQLLLFLP